MNTWKYIWDEHPKEGSKVLGYFKFFDTIEVYEYSKLKNGYGSHLFFNKTGFLTDDIEYWCYLK